MEMIITALYVLFSFMFGTPKDLIIVRFQCNTSCNTGNVRHLFQMTAQPQYKFKINILGSIKSDQYTKYLSFILTLID